MSLVNKIALVTGASSGIGAAIAIKFIEDGAKVAIVGRNESKLKNISEICEKRGNKPLTIIADVSKDFDAKRIINETINFFGRLDILVNNAGIGDSINILDEKAIEVYDKVMNTNLRAAVYLKTKAKMNLHESVPHAVFAISRNTGTFIYYAVDTEDDAISLFIRRVSAESLKTIREYNLQMAIKDRNATIVEAGKR